MMTSERTHYALLGVAPDAPTAVIRAAHRALAKEHHPDRGGDDVTFARINTAADALLDEVARADYDRELETNESVTRTPSQGTPAVFVPTRPRVTRWARLPGWARPAVVVVPLLAMVGVPMVMGGVSATVTGVVAAVMVGLAWARMVKGAVLGLLILTVGLSLTGGTGPSWAAAVTGWLIVAVVWLLNKEVEV